MATITSSLAGLASSLSGSLAPYHLLLYSTLLGTELYQTFVNTKVCFAALPRSAFTTLQRRIFPVYFGAQTALLLLTAVTFPPHGPSSLARHKADWVPHAVAASTAALNLAVYGPRTARATVECIHQESRDAKLRAQGSLAIAGPSPDMQRLRRVFSRNHALCIHLNLVSIGAMVFYGWRLASRMSFFE